MIRTQRHLLAAIAAIGIVALLTGCPESFTVTPPLEVGDTYTFRGHGQGDQVPDVNEWSGTVVQVGPGSWVELEDGSWVNLSQTFLVHQ